MGNRPLPAAAAAALDIIAGTGRREIRTNDLNLLMQQRGFSGRAPGEALRALERRGWLLQSGSVIRISEEAFGAEPATKKAIPSKKKHTRLPRGLFGG